MTKKASTFLPGPLAGLAAGLLFLYLLWNLRFEFLISLLLTAVFFVGLFLVLRSWLAAPALKVDLKDGIGADEAQALLDQGREGTARLRTLAGRLVRKAMADDVVRMVEVCDKILAYLEKEPAKIRQARSFLGTSLEACVSLLEKYAEIEVAGLESESAVRTKERLAAVLPQMVQAFEKQLDRLMENDLMDLDAEIRTMETVFKSE